MSEPFARPPTLDPSSVRALVLDLDGTLIDSYAAIAESVNAARVAFDEPVYTHGQVRRMVGRGLEQLMLDVLGPDRASRGVELFRAHYARVYRSLTHALPGAADALERFRAAGLGLAVASNKPARFTVPILEHLGFAGLITVVHGPDTVGSTKPSPEMIHRCMADLEVERSETVYVGDMVLDVESAARAGVPVVLVSTGSSDLTDLQETGEPVLSGLPALDAMLHRNRSHLKPLES